MIKWFLQLLNSISGAQGLHVNQNKTFISSFSVVNILRLSKTFVTHQNI
jgi:hypothetical protein